MGLVTLGGKGQRWAEGVSKWRGAWLPGPGGKCGWPLDWIPHSVIRLSPIGRYQGASIRRWGRSPGRQVPAGVGMCYTGGVSKGLREPRQEGSSPASGGSTEDVGGQITGVLKHEQEFARRGVGRESGSWLWGQGGTEPGGTRQHLPLGSERPGSPAATGTPRAARCLR